VAISLAAARLNADTKDPRNGIMDDALIDDTFAKISSSVSKESTAVPEWLSTLHRDLKVDTEVLDAIDLTRLRGGRSTLRSILMSHPPDGDEIAIE
jgi:hypothetical protein